MAPQLMSRAQVHQDPGITGNTRRDQSNTNPRIRACQDSQVRRHTRTRLRRSPTPALILVLVKPRTAMINTS